MIVAFQGAAAVGGEHDAAEGAFGEGVVMSAEHRLQIEVSKAIEERVGVGRPTTHSCPERKVGENDGWHLPIQRRESLVDPSKCGPWNSGPF